VALPAAQNGQGNEKGGDAFLYKENNKKFEVFDGEIKLKVTNVNDDNSEMGGVFIQ